EVHQLIADDMRLDLRDRFADDVNVVAHSKLVHVVPQLLQPGQHIVLRRPLVDFFVGVAIEAFRRNERFMHQDEDAPFANSHRTSRCLPCSSRSRNATTSRAVASHTRSTGDWGVRRTRLRLRSTVLKIPGITEYLSKRVRA